MVMSMTGFGRCETAVNGRQITVEMKSVNHRYFEFNCRTTRGYSFLEDKLKKYISQKISRGKIDMYVSITESEDSEVSVAINKPLAAGYVNAIHTLAKEYNIPDDLSVSVLSRYSDIFQIHKEEQDEEQIFSEVKIVLDIALESFLNMRAAEGEKLKEDVLSRVDTIMSIVSDIEKRSPITVEEYRQKLTKRISDMLASSDIDQQRILTEAAIFADKVAVDEETVRLRSHFEQMKTFFESGAPIGRKLDFIVQEMNREANTIGSKVTDSVLAHKVVDIKSEIEKIREQIQNIE
ncbi:MAG: YicC/YloC family endoribonuclease [Eubacteriales bacterium]|nr:YicC/YloC family endoribonuclease [Eubacteriales bacterium]